MHYITYISYSCAGRSETPTMLLTMLLLEQNAVL